MLWRQERALVWWRVLHAVRLFPRRAWRGAWRAAWDVAADHEPVPGARGARVGVPGLGAGSHRRFGEAIGTRHCAICSTDDVAYDGWVSLGSRLICPDCSRAALGGVLPYGRCVAAYRGRVGSPRRSLGEAYRAVVGFKERHADWMLLAAPLARSLARGVTEVLLDDGASTSARRGPLLVPVPSFHGRRPHVHLLTALAATGLPGVRLGLEVLVKTRDFRQKGLSRADRSRESDGAYLVRAAWRRRVRGRHVIVADDLMTTGATLEACARALLAAGASAVDGVTIVRVIGSPPERVVPIGRRQARIQLRELDGRGRAPVASDGGSLWVVFACAARCPVTAIAGPYPLPTFDAVGYHRWMCGRCGRAHLVRVRREWCGAGRECLAVAVGERRPGEVLVGVVQGPPSWV